MRKAWLLFSQTVTVAVALLFVVATLKPQWIDRGPAASAPAASAVVTLPSPVQNVALIGPGAAATSYSGAARRASPAVVSITASRTSTRRPNADDPMYRFFFGDATSNSITSSSWTALLRLCVTNGSLFSSLYITV